MKWLEYNKKDYKIIKDYLYKTGYFSRKLKIKFKENNYSEFFGTNAKILSFNVYDNETVCSFILEDHNKEQEHSYYIFNDEELRELGVLKNEKWGDKHEW